MSVTPYTHRATILLPLTLVDSGVAAKLGQAFDPDVGGEHNFDTVRASRDGVTATHAVCDAWLVAEMSGTMQALAAATPEQLTGWCAQQYAARFPDDAAPTRDECARFLAAMKMSVAVRPLPLGADQNLSVILADLGFIIVTPPVAAIY